MKFLLIVNPAAGQGRPQEAVAAIQAGLGPLLGGVVVTQSAGDAARAARSAAIYGCDGVLVAGGDGTINEAINGLLTAENRACPLPLGVLPLGTQNILASELGLPVSDPAATLALLRAGRTRLLDVGRAGTRFFVLMAGFGFDAVVVRDVLGAVKGLIGPAAYALATVSALAKCRSTAITLTLDGEVIRSEAFLVVVANVSSYAVRRVKVAPFAAPDDGWLDVCVFERPRRARVGFASQMMAVVARRHLRDPRVRLYRARTITLDSDPPVQGQLDGESIGGTPVEISVVPRILPVFVP